MRHRVAHHDRRSTLQAAHAPRGVAAHRQPSRAAQGVVRPPGHLRPMRRVTREPISACLKRDGCELFSSACPPQTGQARACPRHDGVETPVRKADKRGRGEASLRRNRLNLKASGGTVVQQPLLCGPRRETRSRTPGRRSTALASRLEPFQRGAVEPKLRGGRRRRAKHEEADCCSGSDPDTLRL